MLKVTVLKADDSEELFYAETCEVQEDVIMFDTSSGFRAFRLADEQHIKVEETDSCYPEDEIREADYYDKFLKPLVTGETSK